MNEKMAKLTEKRRRSMLRSEKSKLRRAANRESLKILAGAWVLDKAEKRKDFGAFVLQKLNIYLSNQRIEPCSDCHRSRKKTNRNRLYRMMRTQMDDALIIEAGSECGQ